MSDLWGFSPEFVDDCERVKKYVLDKWVGRYFPREGLEATATCNEIARDAERWAKEELNRVCEVTCQLKAVEGPHCTLHLEIFFRDEGGGDDEQPPTPPPPRPRGRPIREKRRGPVRPEPVPAGRW